MKTTDFAGCTCGNERSYATCCEPLHHGDPAADAVALMRSRYSAYVLQLRDYLLKSWHPDTRPASLELDASTKWLGLKVIRQSISGDDAATVEFVARLRSGGNPAQRLHEVSRFVRVAGHWYYLDGEFPEGDAR